MRQQGWKFLASLIVVCGSLLVANIAGAQNPTTPTRAKTVAKEAAAKEATGVNAPAAKQGAKKAKKRAGRLPVFYSDIVTEEQRAQIYGIQASYADKLIALTEQIKAIQSQQSAEIEAVLTEEQKQKLQTARDEAAAKRKQKTAAAAVAKETPKKVATE